MSKRIISFICVFFTGIFSYSNTFAQEIKAKVTVETSALAGIERNIFDDLEQKLTDLINNTKWTNLTFSPAERIQCDISITILSQENNEYNAEFIITAQRPVYNASYTTNILTFRDKKLNFQFEAFTPILYNPNQLDNNLTATIAFYVYLVLALDSDSFSELGGDKYSNQLLQIVNQAAVADTNWKGWTSSDGNKGRYALADALNDPAQRSFRKYWYIYHRKGLDELVGNLKRGIRNIIDNLNLLEATYKARPMSPLLMIFSESKLREFIEVIDGASQSDKKKAFETLNKLYPTEQDVLNQLKRESKNKSF